MYLGGTCRGYCILVTSTLIGACWILLLRCHGSFYGLCGKRRKEVKTMGATEQGRAKLHMLLLPWNTGSVKGGGWPSRSRCSTCSMKAAWSLPDSVISLSLRSCWKQPWKRLRSISLGKEEESFAISSSSSIRQRPSTWEYLFNSYQPTMQEGLRGPWG